MCLLAVQYQTSELASILVLANREESFRRGSTGPQNVLGLPGHPAWVGGQDLQAGGTWLGVNAQGVLVAVTNRRKPQLAEQPRSRGSLCRDLLTSRSAEAARERASRELLTGAYAGCNLLILDTQTGWVLEAADHLQEIQLAPGMFILTNGPLNDPADPRIARVGRELQAQQPRSLEAWADFGQRLCAAGPASDGPAICLTGSEWGTVSSSLIAYGGASRATLYRHAAGSPRQARYDDYSQLLTAVLASEPRNYQGAGTVNESPGTGWHRIALRGPWSYELMRPEGGTAATGTVKWPLTESLPSGDAAESLRWRRRFNPPRTLEADEQVWLVFSGGVATGNVILNGQVLGTLRPHVLSQAFPVTALLTGPAELVLELSLPAPAAVPWDRALPTVNLEFRTNRN